MAKVEIKATKREATGKGACRQLRIKGQLPAVMYSGGSDAVSLSVESRAIERILHSKTGERSILELDIDGDKQLAMIREVQHETVSPELLHVDFIRISMAEKVQVMVPVELLNIEEIRKAGGVTQQALTELNVECLPDSIPESIQIDLKGREVGESIHVSQISVPAGVEMLHEPEEVIASLLSARVSVDAAEGEGEAAEGEEAAAAESGKKESSDSD